MTDSHLSNHTLLCDPRFLPGTCGPHGAVMRERSMYAKATEVEGRSPHETHFVWTIYFPDARQVSQRSRSLCRSRRSPVVHPPDPSLSSPIPQHFHMESSAFAYGYTKVCATCCGGSSLKATKAWLKNNEPFRRSPRFKLAPRNGLPGARLGIGTSLLMGEKPVLCAQIRLIALRNQA